MITRFFVFFLLSSIRLICYSQDNFQTGLQKLLQKQDYKNSIVGVSVIDLKTGLPVYEFNSEKLLVPASTLKILTSASALEILGNDYHFKTIIGYTGEIINGELIGDLIITGGGDPTLGSAYFDSSQNFIENWLQKVKLTGIGKLKGNIILDNSLYDNEKVPPSWNWGDLGNYYGAGPNSLTCYDNLFTITFKSPAQEGERTEIISTNPVIEGLNIDNKVITSNDNRDMANVFGSPFDKKRIITGTIPKNRDSFVIKAAVHQPEELIAEELIQKLKGIGIGFEGKVLVRKNDIKNYNVIYNNESPDLKEIIKILNYESVNLFAEHLVMQIAAEKTGIGKRENGLQLIKEFWQSKGVFSENFYLEDGSGLSHFNAISPGILTSVLYYMAEKSKNCDVFINSLPNAGNGTLSTFNTTYFPENSLKAKSGSMTRVRCYAGYLQLDSGTKTAFSIMFNQFSGSGSKLAKEIENLLFVLKKQGF